MSVFVSNTLKGAELGANQAHTRARSCWQSMYRQRRASYVQSVVLTTLAFVHILFTKYSILMLRTSPRNITGTGNGNCRVQCLNSAKRDAEANHHWVHNLAFRAQTYRRI